MAWDPNIIGAVVGATAASFVLNLWHGRKATKEQRATLADLKGDGDGPSTRALVEMTAANTTSLLRKADGLEGRLGSLESKVDGLRDEHGKRISDLEKWTDLRAKRERA